MLVTKDGITTVVRLVSLKAPAPMLVTESPITTSVSWVSLKASLPMLVTEDGMVTIYDTDVPILEVKFGKSPLEATVAGITTEVSCVL